MNAGAAAYVQKRLAFQMPDAQKLKHLTLCDLYSFLGKMALGEFAPIASECEAFIGRHDLSRPIAHCRGSDPHFRQAPDIAWPWLRRPRIASDVRGRSCR